MSFLEVNQRAWNRLAASGSPFARVATDEECRDPRRHLDGRGWLPDRLEGLEVLCLAAGGGWQSILYACAGARVTVVDLSPRMLEQDAQQAARRGLHLSLIQASMCDLGMLSDQSFDLIHQPVSTCYVPDVEQVYAEVARVARDGALYISQHKQPASLQLVERDRHDRYVLGVGYYHQGPLPPVGDDAYREPGAREYLHRWEALVGGMCRAGFLIEDLREPYRGDPAAPPGHFGHRGLYVAPFVRIKARRRARQEHQASPPIVWTP